MTQFRRQRVLHVAEAFGGGLASAVQAYAIATPEYDHILAFAERSEAPLADGDLNVFADIIPMRRSVVSAVRTIHRALHDHKIDILHIHSSIAGACTRLGPHLPVPIVYTPHCFAFVREDISPTARHAYRAVESFLARRTDVFAACSPYELTLAEGFPGQAAAVYVPNAYDGPSPQPQPQTGVDVHLLGLGRLQPQKDPEFFAQSVEHLRASGMSIEATWIGDGDQVLRHHLERAGVRVTGWLSRQEVRGRLAGDDYVYLHSARWEGFPFGILEAHAAGTPVIVRSINSLRDFEFPHTVSLPSDVSDVVKGMLVNGARASSVRAMGTVLKENTLPQQAASLREAYALALARHRQR